MLDQRRIHLICIDSDSFIVVLQTHIPAANPPFVGWTGALVQVHILDNTEFDVVATHAPFFRNALGPPNGPVIGPSVFNTNPFGPPSNNIQSVPVAFNLYTTVPVSGLNVLTSSNITILSALIHAKNTTSLNNSDIDATLQLWNIYHKRPGFSSVILPTTPLALQWVTSLGGTVVPGGLGSPTAHWTAAPATIHLTTGASGFLATFLGTVTLGIEHVPEPATGILFGAGLLGLAGSRLARRRRLNA